MILGAFATTFPNEMKPSNHTFSPPPLPKNNNDNNNGGRKVKKAGMTESQKNKILRWLDRVFQGQYLPSLYINYLAIIKQRFGKITTTAVLDRAFLLRGFLTRFTTGPILTSA